MTPLNNIAIRSDLDIATSNDPVVSKDKTLSRSRQIAQLWCGHLLLSLGLVGIALPVMPTTVFWIGAAMCYAKSSPDRYRRLIGSRRAGKAIQNYLDHGVISNKGKWAATLGMSFSAALLLMAPLTDLVTFISLSGLTAAATYVITRPGKVPAA